MEIIPLVPGLRNVQERLLRLLAATVIVAVTQLGWAKPRERRYRIEFGHHEFSLVVPVLAEDHGACVAWPLCKAPGRRYPLAAYLYGAARYLCGNESQREVAAQVRRMFGLARFSHSTLSRVIRRFSERVDLLERYLGGPPQAPDIVRRPRWTVEFVAVAGRLAAILQSLVHSSLSEILNESNRLATRYLSASGHFIL